MPPIFDIQIDYDNTEFTPGDTINGTLAWNLPEGTERVALRLFWFTSGRGTQDVDIIEQQTWQTGKSNNQGSEMFSFTLPDEPYSFSGKIVSLTWALEAVTLPDETSEQKEFTLSPNGREIVLDQVTDSVTKPQKPKWFQINR
ncbi:MAG: hypothetical protein AB8F34_09790 [Akkermansiaceae bacterium]